MKQKEIRNSRNISQQNLYKTIITHHFPQNCDNTCSRLTSNNTSCNNFTNKDADFT